MDKMVPCLRPVRRGLKNGEIQGRGFYHGREILFLQLNVLDLREGPSLAGLANRGEDAYNRRVTSDYANVHTVFGRTSHRSWVHGSTVLWAHGSMAKSGSCRSRPRGSRQAYSSSSQGFLRGGPPFRVPLCGGLGTDTLNDLVGSRRESDKIGRTRDGGPDGPYR